MTNTGASCSGTVSRHDQETSFKKEARFWPLGYKPGPFRVGHRGTRGTPVAARCDNYGIQSSALKGRDKPARFSGLGGALKMLRVVQRTGTGSAQAQETNPPGPREEANKNTLTKEFTFWSFYFIHNFSFTVGLPNIYRGF